MALIYKNFMENEKGEEIQVCQQVTEDAVLIGGVPLRDVESQRTDISKIAISSSLNPTPIQCVAQTKKDTVGLVLDSDLKVEVMDRIISISKRVATQMVSLDVDKNNGIDDLNDTTPFKTINWALSFIKKKYARTPEGCEINVTPGDYDEIVDISYFDMDYKLIVIKSTKSASIPENGVFVDGSNYVRIKQMRMNSNSATISFVGFLFDCFNTTNLIISNADSGGDYVVLIDCISNIGITFSKCRITEGIGSEQKWKYYYGFRSFYSNVVIRDSTLGKFIYTGSGGNCAPVRIVDNSNVLILKCNFYQNSLYDIIAEESTVKVRLSKRDDSTALKKNISTTCFYLEGN